MHGPSTEIHITSIYPGNEKYYSLLQKRGPIAFFKGYNVTKGSTQLPNTVTALYCFRH